MSGKLTPEEQRVALASLDGWALSPNGSAISKTFVFADFAEAFAFMTRSALVAEKLGHHPDWSNSWRKVMVTLTTHDSGGLSRLDIDLAARMDAFAA